MSKLEIDSRVYRLFGLTPILGSLPANRELRSTYITSKAPMIGTNDEDANIPQIENENGLTVFNRNNLDQLCIMGYQVKGFFKAAFSAIRSQYRIYAYKSKVDLMLFVEPRFIPLLRDGKPIMQEDDLLERPIRLNFKGAEYTSLKASEMVLDPWSVEIEISLLPTEQKKGDKSAPLDWKAVETALEYGQYHGLGQWRNADYGRFIMERIG